MSTLLPNYDELWVISDIHMGGEKTAHRNFQIFNRGKRLRAFIEYVRARPGRNVGLVLNGDIIDSLAEESVPGYVALDVDTAESMMRRIYDDPAFKPVWTALATFVNTPNRHLVFVLGNHDVELALTPVERSIRRRLAANKPGVDAHIVFATRGGGYSCMVGTSRVFCTHGNEVDGWNDIDYGALAQLDNAINAGRRVDASRWTPNAGTRLVIDVMNKAKLRHPFVDLLKPEIKPVLGVLLALEPGLVREIDFGAGFKVVRELLRGDRRVNELLSATTTDALSEVPAMLTAQALVNEVLGANLAEHVRGGQRNDEDELLIEAELAIANGQARTDGDHGTGEGTLGFTDIVAGWLGRVDTAEGLRRALQDWIGNDQETFALATRDETFERIVARVGPEVDYVVTGHTHLARSIEIGAGRRYFNCGTWIRLLRLTPAALTDPETFRTRVYDVLRQGRMDALDAASIPGAKQPVSLVFDRTNAVRIGTGPNGSEAELLRVEDDDGNGTNIKVVVEKGGVE